jgi:hypothetical protein
MNYSLIIKHKYNASNDDFRVEKRPRLIDGKPSVEEDDFEFVITEWHLPDPQPTIEELELHAQTQAYQDYLAALQQEGSDEAESVSKAKTFLKQIKQERQWLQANWDSAPNAIVKRLMKQNEQILAVLFVFIRRNLG